MAVVRMFERHMLGAFEKVLSQFSAVIVTGARQVGKTTFLKQATQNKNYQYVLLENPDTRQRALEDPRSFLQTYANKIIFDEFQYVPELTSYLQGLIDEDRQNKGKFILTGSQNFLMMKTIQQSLAGRVAILQMHGLSTDEMHLENADQDEVIAECMLRGSFPEIWQTDTPDPSLWYANYLRTYLERDVRNIENISDMVGFEKFVKRLAINTGQVLNQSAVARDCDVSVPTVKRWLDILIQSYQVHLIYPYTQHLTGRIRKAPKLYFWDVGLASFLLGFRKSQDILHAPQKGQLFETLVITNLLKQFNHQGAIPNHYYIQSQTGLEVDLMIEKGFDQFDIYEVKYNRTLQPRTFKQMKQNMDHLAGKVQSATLLCPVKTPQLFQNIRVVAWDKAGETP